MVEKTPKKLIKNLKDLEKLIELVKKHNLPNLKIEGIEILLPKAVSAPMKETKKQDPDEEETLFWSTSAPGLN